MNDQDIELILRQAPNPKVPTDLESTLTRDLSRQWHKNNPRQSSPTTVPFWRQWFPAVSFGVLLCGCFVALGVQTTQLFRLKQQQAELRATAAALPQLREENRQLQLKQQDSLQAAKLQQEHAELLALKEEVSRLTHQLQELPALQAEVRRLKTELDQGAQASPAGDPFAQAKARGLSTACVNNLKLLGLAARMWAQKHQETLPPDFGVLGSYMKSPKGLICPADTNRVAATDWNSVNPTSVSYELISPAAPETDPTVVLSRCPIHGHVGLVDGSVHQVGLRSEKIRQVDGKVRLVPEKLVP